MEARSAFAFFRRGFVAHGSVRKIRKNRLKKEADQSGESLNAICIRKLAEEKKLPKMDNLIEKIQKTFSPLGLILFGSVARGEETKSSDIDLLIVMPLRKTLATIRSQIAEGQYQRKQSHGHCYWITRDNADTK